MRHSVRVPPGENWKNVADHVVARRVELGYRTTRQLALAVGITEKTIGRLEAGHSVRAGTLAAVERELGWLPGSMQALLAGGTPRLAQDRPAPADEVSAARQRIIDATPEELVEIRAMVEEVHGAEAADDWLRKALHLQRSARTANNPVSRETG